MGEVLLWVMAVTALGLAAFCLGGVCALDRRLKELERMCLPRERKL